MNKRLFRFIENTPTAYHTVKNLKESLKAVGFEELCEGREWNVTKGKGYFVSRNGSSLVAFKVPESEFCGFMVGAVHSDSPCLKIKENSECKDNHYVKLSSERYGSMISSTWLDRPLSVAGRLVVKTGDGAQCVTVDLKEAVALIPNVAIHLNRNVNDNSSLNPAVDLVPLYSLSEGEQQDIIGKVADCANVKKDDILAHDLMLYNADKGVEWGDFISAPRLDDLQCVFAVAEGFVKSDVNDSMPVLCVLDNEEVGSSTKQGADSTFFTDVLRKACVALGLNDNSFIDKTALSFMLSCDNAHAVHPNHPELTDANHEVVMNGGIVIKHNANQRYSTDGVSAALFKLLCNRCGVPYQAYANRADIAGGSTLGNIANTHFSAITADIGLAQLAMHSAFETAGAKDTEYMVRVMREFFSASLKMNSDGSYEI